MDIMWPVLEIEFEMALYVSSVSHPFVPKVTRGGIAPSSRLRQVLQVGKDCWSSVTSLWCW